MLWTALVVALVLSACGALGALGAPGAAPPGSPRDHADAEARVPLVRVDSPPHGFELV